MRGVCRGGTGDDDCPGGLHSPLLPHQMPVCDFYLRLVCSKGKDECNYLHVRHTPGTEPCAEFNRGCCHRGILVCFSLVFLRLFLSFFLESTQSFFYFFYNCNLVRQTSSVLLQFSQTKIQVRQFCFLKFFFYFSKKATSAFYHNKMIKQ